MQLEEILKRLINVEKDLDEIKSLLKEEEKTEEEKPAVVKSQKPQEKSDEFQELKEIMEGNNWPMAIDPELICTMTSEQDKEDRAEGIIDLILDTNLKGLKFLDFGCGEGHIAKKIIEQNVSKSTGYDIKSNPKWENWSMNSQGLSFTDNWDKVVEEGPYDIILLYDVIDHIMGSVDDLVSVLSSIKKVMNDNSQIFIRCHPFCSRHGTHLYHDLNKAYAHLVFTEEELASMGYQGVPTRRVIHPLMTYKQWFKLAGFQLYKRDHVYKESVEPFFEGNNKIAKRIKSAWLDSPDENLRSGKIFPRMQLEQQFVDYILK